MRTIDEIPVPVMPVPDEIAAALDASAEDIATGRVGDARELLAQAEERLNILRARAVTAPRQV